jgi:hypothetical protein
MKTGSLRRNAVFLYRSSGNIERFETYCSRNQLVSPVIFTSGRQDFERLPRNGAEALKHVLAFGINHVNYSYYSSVELQNALVQAQEVLSTLYREIRGLYFDEDIPHLENIIVPTVDIDEGNPDSEDDDEQ